MTTHNSPVEDSLLEAVTNGDAAKVRELLVQGMDVNKLFVVEGARDTTPLMMAVDTGNVAILELLLEHGADINQKADNSTALVSAIANNNTEIVRLLLKHGADVNVLFKYESEGGVTIPPRTPLSYAVVYGKAEMVRLLLEHGADVNFRGDHGKDLLHATEMGARIYQHDREVETLLREYGARRDDSDDVHLYYMSDYKER